MSQDFKSQLEALIKKHCDDYDWKDGIKTTNGKHFKQGCELLIPVLMRAIEQRDNALKAFHQNDIVAEYELNLCDQKLLNILKGE